MATVVVMGAVFYTLALSNIRNAGSDLGAAVLVQAIQFIRFEKRKTGSGH